MNFFWLIDVRKLILFPKTREMRKIRRMRNNKDKQSHTTQRFKWFGLTSLHPLAETTRRKFTIKRWSTKIVERKSLRSQSPNTPKSHYHTREIIPKIEYKRQMYKLFFCWNRWRLISIFFSHSAAPFFF